MDHFGEWFVPEPNTGCWLWTLSIKPKGYGQIKNAGRLAYAHRIAYQLLRGPIPKGMTIDHLCRVRCCVNPDHMEVVTNRTNVLRGTGITSIWARSQNK